MSQIGKQAITKQILTDISRSLVNQVMKFTNRILANSANTKCRPFQVNINH